MIFVKMVQIHVNQNKKKIKEKKKETLNFKELTAWNKFLNEARPICK